jgi:hypothetical protein
VTEPPALTEAVLADLLTFVRLGAETLTVTVLLVLFLLALGSLPALTVPVVHLRARPVEVFTVKVTDFFWPAVGVPGRR